MKTEKMEKTEGLSEEQKEKLLLAAAEVVRQWRDSGVPVEWTLVDLRDAGPPGWWDDLLEP